MPATVPASVSTLEKARVEDVMSRGFVGCPLETPLAAVAEMMTKHRVHCVVGFGDVTEDDTRLWGLVSDRDLVAVAAAEGLEGRTAGGCAATEVVTITPQESLRRAAQLMSEHGIAHVLVTDPNSDRPVGVISTLDIARVLVGATESPGKGSAMRVDQLMTRQVVTVPPEMPLKEVAALLAQHRISGVPVVREGEVLGVVSEADLLVKERGPAGATAEGMLGRILGNRGEPSDGRLEARTAGEAMSTPPITIKSWRSAAAAASIMTDRGVKRLPVMRAGELVGIISRADLVRAFARSDADIADDIRREVMLRSLEMSGRGVHVHVHEGEVILTGEVETRLLAELLPEEVRRVPGVVRVRSDVTPGRR